MSQSMLSADNLVITGGTFNQIAQPQSSFSFDKLTERSSARAFHQADSDLTHSTCLPNTRVKILERMKDWALFKLEREKDIIWLNGAAGGGKTSVARTMAKWCDEEGILLAEFFFSRADGKPNQFTAFAPTLAYRMAVHTCKEAKEAICNAVSQDPHIFLAPLSYQLKKLVLEPLADISANGITPYVIILDGIDETLSPDEQLTILNVLTETVQHNSPLRILISSRPEPIIISAFNDSESALKKISTIISLNDEHDSDSDIRRFLVEKFRIIKNQLPCQPKDEWPTRANIDYLVEKSSGQFVFAATVEKYVSSPKHRHLAVTRLKHVLDLGVDRKPHPFADLDALYSLILKTRIDVNISVKTMAVCLEYPRHFDSISTQDLARILGLDPAEAWPILYELASLLDTTQEHIRPFHASFEDFLFDPSRSSDLYVSRGDIITDITCAMLIPRRNPKDLTDTLSRMRPASLFSRSLSSKDSTSTYHLVPLLRQLQNHVVPHVYPNLVSYFDQNFAPLLPSGRLKRKTFYDFEDAQDPNEIQGVHDDSDSNSMPQLHSPSIDSNPTDDGPVDSAEFNDDDARNQICQFTGPQSVTYRVSDVAPLFTSPKWEEIFAGSNIRLTGSDSLRGLCDETRFARTHLPATWLILLNQKNQTEGALFCLDEMTREGAQKDVQDAFAQPLPHSLDHCTQQSPSVIDAIKKFWNLARTRDRELPEETKQAMSKYLGLEGISVWQNSPKRPNRELSTDVASLCQEFASSTQPFEIEKQTQTFTGTSESGKKKRKGRRGKKKDKRNRLIGYQ